jgi:regulator of sigma E protease
MHIAIGIFILIIILSIVIFIHELGHFLAARRAGIFVEEFALGMGPIVFSRRGKKASLDGETTLYSLRALPIGGFCKMRGQDEDVPRDAEALNNKSIPARILVMAGGSIMNFLLAFVLFFVFIVLRGTPAPEIYVASVTEGMPAYEAGLQAGDRITHIDSVQVDLDQNFVAIINEAGERPLELRVLRENARVDLSITPVRQEGAYFIGLSFATGVNFQSANFLQGLSGSAELVFMQATGPFRLLGRLIQGESMPEGERAMGLVGIGSMVTNAYQVTIERGFADMLLTMLMFTGAISAAVGIMNLMPIPALDGARIIFLLIEGIRKKPVPPEKEAIVHLVGIVSLLMLMAFITYRDIANIVGNGYPG